jgi:hypothetical protein
MIGKLLQCLFCNDRTTQKNRSIAFPQETKSNPQKKKKVKCRNPHFPDANASHSQSDPNEPTPYASQSHHPKYDTLR